MAAVTHRSHRHAVIDLDGQHIDWNDHRPIAETSSGCLSIHPTGLLVPKSNLLRHPRIQHM